MRAKFTVESVNHLSGERSPYQDECAVQRLAGRQ